MLEISHPMIPWPRAFVLYQIRNDEARYASFVIILQILCFCRVLLSVIFAMQAMKN